MLEINERIRILRVVQGKSVQEIADVAGVQAARLTAYEKGIYKPKSEAGSGLAAALNVSTDFLFGGRGGLPAQAWYVPHYARTEQRTCADIVELLPGLLQEMQVTYAIEIGMRGGTAFVFGEDIPLDKILVTASPVVAAAIRDAIGEAEIDCKCEQIDLHVADLSSGLDDIAGRLPLRLAAEEIRFAYERGRAEQRPKSLTLSPDVLQAAFEEAQEKGMSSEQFVEACISLTKQPQR